MKHEYFVVVLAHSLRGRLRRVHIPHHAIYVILGLALLGLVSVFGFVSSYARMAWKVANYNALKVEADGLRVRYQKLQSAVNQTNEQMASLQLYAKEVSLAYGIKQKLEGPADVSAEGRLVPTFAETVSEYNFLRGADALARASVFSRRLQRPVSKPSIWPLNGMLRDGFGQRTDPFSGEGAFHGGVDIVAPHGSPVHVTADGIILKAEWVEGFGKLIVVDHGNGVETYYGHLSLFYMRPGQEVRRGEVIAAVGSTGRSTGPHLHYEVRIGGAPVNPYRYHLAKAGLWEQAKNKDFPF